MPSVMSQRGDFKNYCFSVLSLLEKKVNSSTLLGPLRFQLLREVPMGYRMTQIL